MKKDTLHIPHELLGDICRGECVPVIGAGFSKNAVLPQDCNMPLWSDLCSIVATRLGRKPSGDPIKEFSDYYVKKGGVELVKLLRDCLFIRTAKPGAAHMEFAKFPFKQVITTNIDFLLECAYYMSDKPFLPVVDEDLFSFSPVSGETKLIKMHGDLHHPSLLVLTEDHYDSFLKDRGRMSRSIASILAHNTILFIGYSLDDRDFRQIWKLVKEEGGEFRRSAYALLVDASEDEISEYQRRGVTEVISLPKNKLGYGEALTEGLREIYRLIPKPCD